MPGPARTAPVNVPGTPAVSGVVVFTLPDSGGAVGVPQAIQGGQFTESAGSTAAFRVFDGTSAAGVELVPLTELTAHQDYQIDPPTPIEINSGSVYLQIVSGSIEGELYW
jgi:hypothetical protein